MNKNIQIFLGVVILGLGYSAFNLYSFFTEDVPRMDQERAAQETALNSAQAELDRYQKFVQNIEGVKNELKELNLQLESALESMPRSLNYSAVLRNLNQLAEGSGVEIAGFKPRGEEQKSTPTPGKEGAAQQSNGEFFKAVYFDCQMKGSFTRMLVFFDQISRQKRIMNVESVKMKTPQDKASRTNGVIAEMDVTLKAYRFVE